MSDPEHNVALARGVLDALHARDAEALIAISDPDVEWFSFFAISEGGVYRGAEGMKHYMRDLTEAFGEIDPQVDDGIGIGDTAVLVGRIFYKGRESGVEASSEAGWVFKFRDDKVILFRAFRDPEQALGAIGADG